MEKLTKQQNRVYKEALKRLEKKPYFTGVCVDNFPNDKKCNEDFESAVNSVVDETRMWDDPNWNHRASIW